MSCASCPCEGPRSYPKDLPLRCRMVPWGQSVFMTLSQLSVGCRRTGEGL
ncbi:hypothetical protein HMPREF3185_01410 [Porphyromonas somerae]|uniref:Uncharacterized protein n=1 Tax=Porphyromonas somerae TaxID=322095 RepID=A0A134B5Y7_9PORP|nr:hypothetical protein HMPREF3184_01410 [Porphyromonadaceae bacterium KA00676]KXB75352.1 hypothetical protein HMPREF3185_01410 [Porphyromonas somerae]